MLMLSITPTNCKGTCQHHGKGENKIANSSILSNPVLELFVHHLIIGKK